MNQAIDQARMALKSNEVPVGAVIIDNKTGRVVAKAHNQNITKKDSTAHAEILAIRQACEARNSPRLDNCSMYVTLEPCPMCASAISLSRIEKLYYGAHDPKSGGIESGPKIYSHKNCHHKPEIYSSIQEDESSKLLKEFFAKKR